MDGKYAQFFVPVVLMVIAGCSLGLVYWRINQWFRTPPLPQTRRSNLLGVIVWFQFVAMVLSMVVLSHFIGRE